jgi:glycosyltransferase involved in cell wall biosynthesis
MDERPDGAILAPVMHSLSAPPAVAAGSGGGRGPGESAERCPEVTVVIATYNHAHLLGRALVSVLCQTVQDYEVIVVDDASEDGTAEVVGRLDDRRIRLVRLRKHGGAARAWNIAVGQARGEWVAFLDSDDEWLPRKLELQLGRAREQAGKAIAVVYCRYYRQGADGERALLPTRPLPEGDVLDELLTGGGVPTTSGYLVRRDALLQVGGFDEALQSAQDLNLLLRLASASQRFTAVHEPLFIKHNHAGRQIRTDPFAKIAGFRAIDRRWGALMQERLGLEAYEHWREERSRKISRLHRRHLKRVVRSGSRSQAWRYAMRMVPFFPWGARFLWRALTFAALGRLSPAGSAAREWRV